MTASQVQTRKGSVVKISAPHTVRIATRVSKVHPIYKKRYTVTRYFLAHDNSGDLKVGDEVTIRSCKPISKLKRWEVVS